MLHQHGRRKRRGRRGAAPGGMAVTGVCTLRRTSAGRSQPFVLVFCLRHWLHGGGGFHLHQECGQHPPRGKMAPAACAACPGCCAPSSSAGLMASAPPNASGDSLWQVLASQRRGRWREAGLEGHRGDLA